MSHDKQKGFTSRHCISSKILKKQYITFSNATITIFSYTQDSFHVHIIILFLIQIYTYISSNQKSSCGFAREFKAYGKVHVAFFFFQYWIACEHHDDSTIFLFSNYSVWHTNHTNLPNVFTWYKYTIFAHTYTYIFIGIAFRSEVDRVSKQQTITSLKARS